MRFAILLFLVFFTTFADSLKPIRNLYYDEDRARIGKKLFQDTRLSPSGRMSCEYCHNLYWKSNGTTKYNVNVGLSKQINPPTVLNAALNLVFFHNGRKRSLKSQVEESINDVNQLASSKELIMSRLNVDPNYVYEFKRVYGRNINFDDVVDALVNFERALITPNSKFDRFLNGEKHALTVKQKKGFEIFKKKGCIECHNGVNLGANLIFGAMLEDEMDARKKVPTLRNILITKPYGYDGSVDDLKEMIKNMNFTYPLSDDDVDFIYEFLHSLTGERPEILNEK